MHDLVSDTNELVCDKSACMPCWAFGVILEGIVFIACIVVFTVHVSGAYANDTTQMNVLKGSLISLVVFAHIVVILVARFCKDENNCADLICLPCWVYWVIQNGIIISTIACVILINVLCDKVKIGFCYWKLYAIIGIATHAAIILAAEYCKMWDTRVEKRCLTCWVYGGILAGIILVAVVCAILIKACSPAGRIGGLWYWEMFTLAGFFIVTIYLVFVVIFAGACKKSVKTSDASFGCWAIYLVIFGVIVISVTCCMFIYVFLEPGRSAKVISRKIDDKGMSVRVQWESRLTELKTYYIQLECKGKMLDPIELDYKSRQDGFLEYELTGLLLDTDYQAHLYSVVCKLPSMNNKIKFDTKGRPMPPTNIYQDERMRTEDSITLRWTAAKGPEHHFVVTYKRSKRPESVWEISDKISSNWYTIKKLKPGISYAIIVYAENNLGRSEESEPLFVKTRALKPVPPNKFKCKSSTENEVQLSWKPSKKLKNQQFLLTVFNNSDDPTKYEQEKCIQYNGEQTMMHTVSQLKPGCEYQFEIITSAGNVLSESSRIVIAETKGIRKEQFDLLKQTNSTTVFHVNNEN